MGHEIGMVLRYLQCLIIKYMWPDLRKPDMIAHFWKFSLLYHYVLGTKSFSFAAV